MIVLRKEATELDPTVVEFRVPSDELTLTELVSLFERFTLALTYQVPLECEPGTLWWQSERDS